jgi:hypothetical protein
MGANMGETISTACQRLQEADQAYHDLMRGGMIRAVTDENGEQIAYSQTDMAALLAYIKMLAPQCPSYIPTAMSVQPKPMRFIF